MEDERESRMVVMQPDGVPPSALARFIRSGEGWARESSIKKFLKSEFIEAWSSKLTTMLASE